MIRKIIEKYRDYCERNERADKNALLTITEEEMSLLEQLPKLPNETEDKIKNEKPKDLYILEIYNNDITPFSLALELIKKYCLIKESVANEMAMNIHNKGKSQIMAGSKKTLSEVAKLIEESAVKLKYTLKCNVYKA